MANICMFDMTVVGLRKNIDALFNLLEKSAYDKEGDFKTGELFFSRIIDIQRCEELPMAETNRSELLGKNREYVLAQFTGAVKWGLYSSIAYGIDGDTYIFNSLQKNLDPVKTLINLQTAAKNLDLLISIDGEERMCMGYEHLLVNRDETIRYVAEDHPIHDIETVFLKELKNYTLNTKETL